MPQIEEGKILIGPDFPEKVKVISSRPIEGYYIISAKGLDSKTHYERIIPIENLSNYQIIDETQFTFKADGKLFFLYLEIHRIRNASQFDPLYAVNVSQVEPLPHQIDAVYNYILQKPRIRFLLADDPGAGKTIMAGLIIKELKLRGIAERFLIVVPGHLKDQWQRELKEKFQEKFYVIDRNVMNSAWGQNIFDEKNMVIISMDFAKQDSVMAALQSTHWDLCIVDEAHKLSAYKYGMNTYKTQRYRLGEILSEISNFLLFLTATPHRGDPENFRLFLELLEPGMFANTEILNESISRKDNPLFLKRKKEDLKDFEQRPIYPPRTVKTIGYQLSEDEINLYNNVTKYVEVNYNKASEKDNRNVTFALIILQRRLASSVYAVRKSLERRHNRLKELYNKSEFKYKSKYLDFDEYDELDDYDEATRWKIEDEALEALTSADNLEELKKEIDTLDELANLAKVAEKKEIETKLSKLKEVMDSEHIRETGAKLLIFTEFKDTLEYLVHKLQKWGYNVAYLHGGMNLDERIKAEREFNNNPNVQIMVSTEAGGEGINLQKACWIMVNYDIPWNPNRLEQRMGRIHRYGQRHEVHIYNLVATNTREGSILKRLFDKLETIQDHLGSDRVFDVIGEVLYDRSLKDLILDAIKNPKTLDDIYRNIEEIPDQEIINRIREATQEALATSFIDLSRVNRELRNAKENRLVPEYIEKFFQYAADLLKIKMHKIGNGLWHISSVPLEIRNQPQEFKYKYGEVLREYAKVSFDREIALKSQAEFIAMGHPLLEAVCNEIIQRHSKNHNFGAIFTDPEGKRNGIIWFVEGIIKDGKNQIAGKRIFAIYQPLADGNSDELQNSNFSLVNPAIIWDLKPVPSEQLQQFEEFSFEVPQSLKDKLDIFIFSNCLSKYKEELLQQRQRDAEIKKKYAIDSLEKIISDMNIKIIENKTQVLKGNIINYNIQQEELKLEDAQRKLERLKKDIKNETSLSYELPEIIGAIRVVPEKLSREMSSDKEIEKIGMQVAMEYERNNGRIPEDVSSLNLGYDIRSLEPLAGSTDNPKYRYIEVKARASDDNIVALTPNEWLKANRFQDEYWLYVVKNAATKPELITYQNPTKIFHPLEEVETVRYIIQLNQATS